MNQQLYDRLTVIAKSEDIVTYGQIAPVVGLSMDVDADRAKMSAYLEEIVRNEHAAGRPLLTSIVVHAGGDNNPGEGFFQIATELKYFSGSRDQFKRLQFWVDAVKKTHRYWSAH